MKGNHPKRRMDKYNPYRIYEKNGHYYIAFKSTQNVTHEFEIPKYLYDVFDYFELEDLRYLNEWERHYEREEVWETTLNTRAVHKSESLEDIVLRKLQIENLHRAMQNLSETQRRRIYLYFFESMTYEQIAGEEGCSKMSVKRSVDNAIKKLRREMKKFKK